jgi:hypothetical protein
LAVVLEANLLPQLFKHLFKLTQEKIPQILLEKQKIPIILKFALKVSQKKLILA